MRLLDIHFSLTNHFCKRFLRGRHNTHEVAAIFIISMAVIANLYTILAINEKSISVWFYQILFAVVMTSLFFMYVKKIKNEMIKYEATWTGKVLVLTYYLISFTLPWIINYKP